MGVAGYGRIVLSVSAKVSRQGNGPRAQDTIVSFAVGIRLCVRTFVFCGRPELGQLGGVCPIELRIETKGGTIYPWLGSRRSCGTPKNQDITFGRVGVRKWIADDDFDTIWINCADSSKCDVGGRIDNRREDEVCGE
jgi:hypothetical protein